jgi:hypothetical protein
MKMNAIEIIATRKPAACNATLMAWLSSPTVERM